MTNVWTFIPKPTGTPYINVNPQGKEQYDQANISYDEQSVFYDGINTTAWTSVPKPASGAVSFAAGIGNGLLIPLTHSSVITIPDTSWTKVPKPIT